MFGFPDGALDMRWFVRGVLVALWGVVSLGLGEVVVVVLARLFVFVVR